VEGFSLPDKRFDRVVLEAHQGYWAPARFPRLQRIIFDNTLSQKEVVELVKTSEGRVDMVTGLSPLETLRVAQSPFAVVVKNHGALVMVFGQFNMRKAESPNFAVDGPNDWVSEQPALRQFYAQVLGSVDREQQQALIRQMERHSRDHVYFLFLYNPIQLYAVNKSVQFVPYVSPLLNLFETGGTDQHWSVRKQKAARPE
jgi:hypothetical protein